MIVVFDLLAAEYSYPTHCSPDNVPTPLLATLMDIPCQDWSAFFFFFFFFATAAAAAAVAAASQFTSLMRAIA